LADFRLDYTAPLAIINTMPFGPIALSLSSAAVTNPQVASLNPTPPVASSASSPPPGSAQPPQAARRPADRQLGDRVRSLSLSRLPERRSAIWTNLGIVAVVALLGGGGWYGYKTYQAQQAAGPGTAATTDHSTGPGDPQTRSSGSSPVETPRSMSPSSPPAAASAPPGKGEIVLESKGYIVPAHQILVSPKVSGMIVQLNIEEGRRVTKGDILAVLESTDYEADLQRAMANVQLMRERLRELENGNRPEEIKEAEAELRENEAQLVQLETDYRRLEDLRRRNSVTQQELELAQSKYLAQQQRVARLQFAHTLMKLGPREERIAVAKAELAQAEADVVKTKWRLGNCTIRAPVSGTILKKNAEEGNIVNSIAFNGSFSLCEMADLSDLEVDLNIQERDISVIQVGQKCRVRAEAYPDRIYDGYVDRLMPIADRAKGAIPVRVKVHIPPEEEGVYLKPEMGAIVTFLNQHVTRPAGVALERSPETPHADETPVSTSP
jgi:multidrug resistance efflux pump